MGSDKREAVGCTYALLSQPYIPINLALVNLAFAAAPWPLSRRRLAGQPLGQASGGSD